MGKKYEAKNKPDCAGSTGADPRDNESGNTTESKITMESRTDEVVNIDIGSGNEDKE